MARYSHHARSVLSQKTSAGGSADTFQGFLAYLQDKAPDWFIWENVEKVMEGEGQEESLGLQHNNNLDIAIASFGGANYETQAFVINSIDYALPQSRCLWSE